MLTALLLSLFAAFWPSPECGARACDCMMPGTVTEVRETSAAVFTGTVASIRDTTLDVEGQPYWMRVVTLRVDRAWKGVQAETVTLVTGSGGGDCGYHFEVRKRYLVYATRWNRAPGAPLTTSICTRTALLARAGEDLRELGAPVRTWTAAAPGPGN